MRKPLVIAVKAALALLGVLVVIFITTSVWLIWRIDRALPDVGQLAANSPTGPICSSGNLDAYVLLDEIPLLIRQTAILYGDPEFYKRTSLNPFTEMLSGFATGHLPRPSSITMSVTRCLESLSPNRFIGESLERQVSFLFLMSRTARVFPRDRILEIYLNESYFGRSAYGVSAASEAYFGKSLERLGIDEIAFIVAITRLPKAPTYLVKNRDRVTERRNYVVDRMLQAGIISANDATVAKERPLELRQRPPVDPKPE